ncbi:hypothetical protein [Aurantibacter sp.]|uniref:hypothetical protein n=1 Tax=Aurantibacter sp. TaxID=2807103 RepID=UPI0035C85375
MNPIIKNILAIVLGWLLGSTINMLLIQTGHSVFPIEGIDINNMDALSKVMPTLEYNYFIFPFLAHALGTLIGAFLAFIIAENHKMKFALAIGFLFLLGGIAVNYMISGPIWFTITDVLLAYIPMAWIGGQIAKVITSKKQD